MTNPLPYPAKTAERWTRREFARVLALTAGAMALPAVPSARAAPGAPAGRARPRVAILTTRVQRQFHSLHFIGRLLEGYAWQGAWHRPPLALASLYVDQFSDADLARDYARRHNVVIYPTVAEALTLGGPSLAVDAVLIIGEHGQYPVNEKGQTLYPRHRWFKEVVRVFEASGRAVPVFNDKHLSTDWGEARAMVAEARRLGFAFMAGSSLPVARRIPDLELPLGAPLTESVCVCYGGVDSYDFHGLEAAQCMSERRAGGESGIRRVHALKGEAAWEWLDRQAGTRELALAALARSHTTSAPHGYTYGPATWEWLRRCGPDTVLYRVEHVDGFFTTLLLLRNNVDVAGLELSRSRLINWQSHPVRDFNYAGRMRSGEIVSCNMYLCMSPWPFATSVSNFFNPQMHHVEQMVLTGREPYPVERTLLTTGMLAAGVDSLYRGEPVATPDMGVAYLPAAASTYWRA
ncbi:MAG: hypothetical protein JNG83_06950 [Opitutaceae bacterium]|nr:hypothetical protein [Opitutaceae bacterium]